MGARGSIRPPRGRIGGLPQYARLVPLAPNSKSAFTVTGTETGAPAAFTPVMTTRPLAKLFGSSTAMIASDITRGHRNKMRRDAEFVAYGSDSSWAKKVDFNG